MVNGSASKLITLIPELKFFFVSEDNIYLKRKSLYIKLIKTTCMGSLYQKESNRDNLGTGSEIPGVTDVRFVKFQMIVQKYTAFYFSGGFFYDFWFGELEYMPVALGFRLPIFQARARNLVY